MKKMMVSILTISTMLGLSACGTKSETEQNREKYKEYYNVDEDGNGVADWQEKEITINFAPLWGWISDNLNGYQWQIDAFTEKYPNITVNIKDDLVGLADHEITDTLIALDALGEMPDIFQTQNPTEIEANNLGLNILPYLETDEEFGWVRENNKEAMWNKDKTEMVRMPFHNNIYLVIANTSILEAEGIEVPGYDWTYEEYEDIRSQVREKTKTKCIFAGEISMDGIGPRYFDGLNPGFRGYDYETNSFQLSSATNFGEYMKRYAQASQRKEVWAQLSQSEKQAKCDGFDGNPFDTGQMVFREGIWQGTWDIQHHMNFLVNARPDDNIQLYPLPKAPEGGVTAPISYYDFMAIRRSLQTDKVKAEAVAELLKWITFKEEGMLAKYQAVYDNLKTPLDTSDKAENPRVSAQVLYEMQNGWPITDNPNVINAYPYVKGFTEEDMSFDDIDSSITGEPLERVKTSLKALELLASPMYKSKEFQESIQNATMYPRYIPGFREGADGMELYEHIAKEMINNGTAYSSIAKKLDEEANRRLEEATNKQ